ncbi:MAG TPA: hypothetical protein VEA69_04600 [Tepidisphaeraceae bacterium]|nr:hypothetical protein [Tepidisphaeraceae bacterium]
MHTCRSLIAELSAAGPDRALALLRELSRAAVGCAHAWPALHRVCDVVVGGEAFRVVRCAGCAERSIVERIRPEVARPDQPGVPCDLTGERLRRWVAAEEESPTKEDVDWDKWLA